mmetsp:Transcript_39946/g.120784  ORF Transcript_39946/g.120784 Transcript_39946/m.120784 type:complete len:255 (+) Transcript_39946:647-1411(+)
MPLEMRELREHLLAQLSDQGPVLPEISDRDQSVAVDPLALVDPQQRHLFGVGELRRLRLQQASEDAAQVADVEFVMHVLGGLPERVRHLAMERQGRLDDARRGLLDRQLEGQVLEVALDEGRVDAQQRRLLGEGDGARPKVPLEALVHDEGARGRIHAAQILRIADLFHLNLVPVVPMRVILLLLDQLDRALRVILVQRRHVQIIDEIHHLQLARRCVQLAGLLLQRSLHHALQQRRIGVEAHVHLVEHESRRV